LLLAFAVLLAVALSPSSAWASTRCGRVSVPAYHHKAKVRIVSGKAKCSDARRLVCGAFTAVIKRPSDGTDADLRAVLARTRLAPFARPWRLAGVLLAEGTRDRWILPLR
jgi:hypothetical protein